MFDLKTVGKNIIMLTLGVILLSGCIKSYGAKDQPKEIIVFAAASLTESFTAIEEKFEEENEMIDIIYNFAGSQMLTSQIEAGGNPDCFFSANTKYPMKLITEIGLVGTKSLVEEDMHIFATNELIIVINESVSVDSIEGLFGDIEKYNMKIVVANESVPVGKYTQNLLTSLSEGGYEEGVTSFYDHIISYENDVKSVVAKVEMKEADIGVVYKTDLVNVDLNRIEIPSEYNQIATYGSLMFNENEEVQAFYQYVLTGEGKDILEEFNFGR